MFRTNGMPRAQAGIVPYNPLHFLRPWRSDAHDCRDAGGRATQEQLPRSGPTGKTMVGATGEAGRD